MKIVVDGPYSAGQSHQRQPTFQHMHNPGDYPPVVDPPGTGLVLWQMRLDRCPRFIRQSEQSYASLLLIYTPVNQENRHASRC